MPHVLKMKDGKLLTPFGIRDLLDAVQDYAGEELRREIEEYIETNVQDARWKEAEEFITQHGTIVKTPSGYWQQVPQVSIAQTYLKIMNKFAEQFGLTPSSRSRIIASDGGPADVTDEMENLLGGGGS